MKFRTEIDITDAPKILSPERLVLFVGSCFSDNIGSRLQSTGWPAVVNPCGVVYNPLSIAALFRLALADEGKCRKRVEESVVEREGRFVSWFMGSKVMASTPRECADMVCECIGHLREGLLKAGAVVVTFGTPDVWYLSATGMAVGNCHKHPAREFSRRRLGIDEIGELWKTLVGEVRQVNPGVRFIFTVSPRRYLSEGFADNSRLKAVLLLACEAICREISDTYYFPAYEILNDDLRDYRFYADDLLHPSSGAVAYIWEKFVESYVPPADRDLLHRMERAARAAAHHPRHMAG